MALYSIAGLTVQMTPRYAILAERSVAYRLPEDDPRPVDFTLELPPDEFAGLPPARPGLTPPQMEYLFFCGLFYRRLLSFDGLMLHASAVATGGRVYCFSAPPGTGKSTHTAGWLRALGEENAFILNDDKPALRRRSDGFWASGTPFSGTSPLNRNQTLPLGGICFLSRGEQNAIRRLSPKEALPLLYGQTVRVVNQTDGRRLAALLCDLARQTPFFHLQCTVGRGAVQCAYEAMTGRPLPPEKG